MYVFIGVSDLILQYLFISVIICLCASFALLNVLFLISQGYGLFCLTIWHGYEAGLFCKEKQQQKKNKCFQINREKRKQNVRKLINFLLDGALFVLFCFLIIVWNFKQLRTSNQHINIFFRFYECSKSNSVIFKCVHKVPKIQVTSNELRKYTSFSCR